MKFAVLLLICGGCVSTSFACRLVTTKKPTTTGPTTTPPTTRKPTFDNTCTGANDGQLLDTLISVIDGVPTNQVSDVQTFTGSSTQKVKCYVIRDYNDPSAASRFTVTNGAINSNSIQFTIVSATGEAINADIEIYGTS